MFKVPDRIVRLREALAPARLAGRLRRVRWRRAAVIGAALAVVGIGVFVSRDRLFVPQLPPEFAQYSERAADPVALGEFLSYESTDSVAAKLSAWGYPIERSDSHKPPSRRYPRRDLDSIEVSGYHHLEQRGRLRLEFFNDRLYEAHFEPDEVRRYVGRLRAAEPQLKRDKIGKADLTRGAQRIVTNVELANSKVGRELGTQAYVIWQDLRLKEQLAQWEAQYGPLSVRSEE